MPTNTNAPKKKRTFKVKVPKEKLYKVTLTFSFVQKYDSSDDLEKDEYGLRETNKEFCERIKDWNETEKEYGTDEKIQAHVKSFDAKEFVEYLPPGEVRSAKWLDGFSIAFIFKPESPTYQSVSEIKDWLETFSLEDGEYESGGDNGWTVKTLKETMEYGLTDYRDNPIVVEEVSSNVISGGKRRLPRQTRRR
jgi:hypothetical protein